MGAEVAEPGARREDGHAGSEAAQRVVDGAPHPRHRVPHSGQQPRAHQVPSCGALELAGGTRTDRGKQRREERAERREQRAESREQRAESREQRAERREQRGERREQRTER